MSEVGIEAVELHQAAIFAKPIVRGIALDTQGAKFDNKAVHILVQKCKRFLTVSRSQ